MAKVKVKNTSGWIRLHRQLKENWIWHDPVKLKWWIDILLSSNHEDNKVLIKGVLTECKRGQCVKSLSTWAKDWRTTKKTVQCFFKLLAKEEMILIENIKITTRLTICKYESYNNSVNADDYAEYTQTTTHGKRTLPPNNNENNYKNDKEEIKMPFSSEDFLFEWDAWKKYKREQHKFNYKSGDTEQRSLNLLFAESGKNESSAISMLNTAMAKGWKCWVATNDVSFTAKKTEDVQANGLTAKENAKIFG